MKEGIGKINNDVNNLMDDENAPIIGVNKHRNVVVVDDDGSNDIDN